MALPLAIGNYPQAVRNLSPLIQTDDLFQHFNCGWHPRRRPMLSNRKRKVRAFPDVFVAISMARSAKRFDPT